MLRFSNMRIVTVISMHTFPSVSPSTLLGISLFGPHEIMWTLFFGAGGGELGDSSSVSLVLLFEEPLVFRLAFGVAGASSSSPVSSLVSTFFGRMTLTVMIVRR